MLLLGIRPAAAGPDYPNGFPADPGFFPIGVWLQSPGSAPAYKAIGINTFVGLWQGPTEEQLAELAGSGMFAAAPQNALALNSRHVGVIKAWLQADEPDNAQPVASGGWGACIPAAAVAGQTGRWQARDPSRPVMINFGRGVADAEWPGRGVCTGDAAYYDTAARGAGILSFDVYPVANSRPAVQDKLEYVARGVCNLRRRAVGRAIWAAIETTAIESHRRVSPAQLRSEVWMALIHGAAGIYYFVHEWTSGFREDAVFRYPEIVAAVAAVDRTIAQLAPLLNSPGAAIGVAIASPVPIAAIARRQPDAVYLFAAAMRDAPAKVAFVLSEVAGGTAMVIDENRSIPVADGAFEDAFDGYGVHLYRIVPAASGQGGQSPRQLPTADPCGAF